jgi:hypothetical protein
VTNWFQAHVVDSGKLPLAVLFLAFAVTFLFIRLSVRMIRAQVRWWPGNVSPGGTHLHHVVFGIVFMLIAGAGGFSTLGNYSPWSEIFAGVFGAGAALVLDEFALVLHLRDVYWSEQGRTSVDAVFLAFSVIGLLLVGTAPLGANSAEPVPGTGGASWTLAVAIALNLVLVLVTLLKGKVWTGLLGIFVPLLALVGAVRLARPHSAWARRRYRPDSKKLARAARRDGRTRQWFVQLRNKLQDAVAGKPSS